MIYNDPQKTPSNYIITQLNNYLI